MKRIILIVAILAGAVHSGEDRAALVARIDGTLAKTAKYLIVKQSADGAWRSNVYSCFKAGPALTPVICAVINGIPDGGDAASESFQKATGYIRAMTAGGSVDAGPFGLDFPVYTAGNACRMFALKKEDAERNLSSQKIWLNVLLERQIGSQTGWPADALDFGGWSYSTLIPQHRAGDAGLRPFIANISATLFALGGMRAAHVPEDSVGYREALIFVQRCQNFADGNGADPKFDDGGFVFSPGDPAGSKAGIAGTDSLGRVRLRSYGSATADGLRALLCCGIPKDHPRVLAARHWLEVNFSASENPGDFATDRDVERASTYYYYAWSVSHALLYVSETDIATSRGNVCWPEALSIEILRRCHEDGSWANHYAAAKEDDPLVATTLAATALVLCRRKLMPAGK